MNNLNNMTIDEIDNYGRDIQSGISSDMDIILEKAKDINNGRPSQQLGELSLIANKSTRSLQLAAPIIKVQKWLGKYDGAERQIEALSTTINDSKADLDTVLYALYDSKYSLEHNVEKLGKYADNLESYLQDLQSEAVPDGLRIQAVANRLKILTTLKASADQVLKSTIVLISENKEVSRQMEEIIVQVTPMFKMMLVNTIAIKTQNRALALQKVTKKMLNGLMLDHVKEIEAGAEQALENRNTAIIDPETIEEANAVLQRTVKKVLESNCNEVEANLEVVRRLQLASNSMNEMSSVIQQSIDEKNSAILIDGDRY